jgi:phosphate transport system substrate-binding protein
MAATSAAASPSAASTAAVAWTPRDVTTKLTGSGSSFVDPAMQLWIQKYKDLAQHVSINYQSVGSGQGKKDFIGNVTDFAGTDAYMTDDELKMAPGSLHIPVVLGPEAIIFNLSGVSSLQLSGPTLADIYLGKITKWNDPEIAADNPGASLPSDSITVVHRSDGSGTTAIFTNYLSKVSPEWMSKVGFNTAVQWPVGIGGEQNPGVAAGVQQTPGAIGYVELAYAIENKLTAASIKNAAGKWVMPSLEGASADAAGFLNNLPDDLRVFITNAPTGDTAYPITGFSWVLLRPSYDDVNKANALTDFCYFCITQGQTISQTLQYAPIPDEVKTIELKKIEQVMSGGKPVFTAPA